MRLSDRVHMPPPPPGHWYLYQAVDQIGRATWGSGWIAVGCRDELKSAMEAPSSALQGVIMSIAEACEAGKLAAAYPDAIQGGVDVLDPREWGKSRLHVETYFATGEVVLYLPYLDPLNRPDLSRPLARCTRIIYIRKDSLETFIAELEPASAPIKSDRSVRHLTKKTVAEFVSSYIEQTPNPTKTGLRKFAADAGYVGGRAIYEPEFAGQMLKRGKPIKRGRPEI